MATLLRRLTLSVAVPRWTGLTFSPLSLSTTLVARTTDRGLGAQEPPYRDECVVQNSDGSIIACWHPEPKFPYELTRPVPRAETKTDEKLKVQFVKEMEDLYHFKHERLQIRDLMRLTWTTKHRWFQHYRIGYRREATRQRTRERPYL